MSQDRRTFFKTLGVIGVTIAVGNSFGKAKVSEKDIEFYGILYDSTRCAGCQTCEMVCAETNGLPEPTDSPDPNVLRKKDENHRTVVNCFNTSKGEFYNKTQCMHCNEPACVAACLTQAMYKTKQGPVIWREDKCMGCRYCMVSCPFDVPKFEYLSSNPRIEKCTMCYDRIKDGGIPACTESCPAEAITFGTRKELLAEAKKRIAENPDMYYNEIYGYDVAGGTAFLYLSAVPFNEIGMNTKLQNKSYPELSKGFLFSVPSIFVFLPPLLLGIYEATKRNQQKENLEDE